MKEMNKFVIKSVLFFIILVGLFLSLNFFEKIKKVKSDYMAAIIDKHRQAENIRSPKIIFAGGSNLAFSINSNLLEKEIGLPVINMGLHAGLGLSFILNELKFTAHEDDIIFFSVEYFMETNGAYDLKKNAEYFYPPSQNFFISNYSLEAKEYIRNKQQILQNIISHNNRNIDDDDTTIYSRKSFNDKGDITSHLNKISYASLGGFTNFTNKSWEGIIELNSFSEYAKQKKINSFFLFPTYSLSAFNKNYRAIKLLEEDLRKLLDIEILGTSIDFAYPDSLFFDSIYHLNKEGREKRTRALIEIIKKNTHVQKAIARARLSK